MGQTRTSSLGAARPLPPRADIGLREGSHPQRRQVRSAVVRVGRGAFQPRQQAPWHPVGRRSCWRHAEPARPVGRDAGGRGGQYRGHPRQENCRRRQSDHIPPRWRRALRQSLLGLPRSPNCGRQGTTAPGSPPKLLPRAPFFVLQERRPPDLRGLMILVLSSPRCLRSPFRAANTPENTAVSPACRLLSNCHRSITI